MNEAGVAAVINTIGEIRPVRPSGFPALQSTEPALSPVLTKLKE